MGTKILEFRQTPRGMDFRVNVKPEKSILSFFENERIGNSYPEQYRQNPRSFSRPRMLKRITPLESSREI